MILSPTAHAQTITAASCSASDVQAAFDSVTSATTLVIIPACGSGGATWTQQVRLSVPAGSASLTIQGQGLCTPTGTPGKSNYSLSCNDASEITDGDATNQPVLDVTNVTGFLRITGLTIKAGSGVPPKDSGTLSISGTSTKIRVDHDHFVAQGDSHMVQFDGCVSGVTDHNLSDSPTGNGSENTFRIYNAGSCYGDALGVGDQSWAHPTQLGSSNFMFVENNVFNNGASDDCSQGGRMVIRYNYFSETGPAPAVQTHATGASARWRGCRAWEVYDNYFYPADSAGEQPALYMTSGTGVVWNNTVAGVSSTQGFKGLIVTHDSRVGVDYGESPTPSGWGYCGQGKTGVGSNWDENSDVSTGYHCIDQVGMGQSDLIVNDFPNMKNATTGCAATTYTAGQTCARFHNALEPVYDWGNHWDNTLGWTGLAEWANADQGTEFNNVDYYLWCDPSATTGCTSAFDGSQGVGSGTLAARPSTCKPMVAYWATDKNTLYKCTAPNTWTSFYSPYTYPHPLDNASGSAGSSGGGSSGGAGSGGSAGSGATAGTGGTDAGGTAGGAGGTTADAGTDASNSSASNQARPSGGCGCETPRRQPVAPAGLLLSVLGLGLVLERRRCARP